MSLPIVPLSQCLAAYGSNMLVSDINICAGDVKVGGIDACLVSGADDHIIGGCGREGCKLIPL